MTLREVPLWRLFNAWDRTATPEGAAFDASNCSAEKRALRLMPRYGDAWARASANSGDVGAGLFYANYNGTEEYLAVVQHNGEAFSRLYTVNVSTGVWTQVSNGGASPDPQNLAAGGTWHMEQHGGTVYIVHHGASTTMYKRAIGVSGSATAFETFSPTYNRGSGFGPRVDTTYPQVQFGGCQMFSTAGTWTLDQIGAAGARINAAGATGPGDVYLVFSIPSGLDLGNGDLYDVKFDKSANVNTPVQVSLCFTEDDESTVNLAWCQSLAYGTQANLANTAGTTYVAVYDQYNGVPAPSDRKAAKRLVVKVNQLQVTGAATLKLERVRQGGFDLWDVAAVTSIGYAVRWVDKRGASPVYTQFTELPDVTVADLQGELVHASFVRMGSRVVIEVPYFETKANEGYGWVQVRRQDSATSTDWYQVAEERNESPGPIQLHDYVRQSVVDAGASAMTPQQGGPPADIEVIGLWKRHLALAKDGLVWLSYGNLPGEFVPAPDELTGAYDTDDDDLGRTFYAAPGRRSAPLQIVGDSELFFGTDREVLYMVGDSAVSASPPRPLPGNRGILSRRSMAAYAGGCLAAHVDGLWWYSVSGSPLGAGSVEVSRENLTAEVPESWVWLLAGGAGTNLVVAVMEEEVWVFNKQGSTTRVLRRTRPDPVSGEVAWQPGAWAGIVAAAYAPGRGLRAMRSDGQIVRIGFDANGAAYTTDAGSAAPNWEATSGDFVSAREEVVRVYCECDGTPTVRISVDDGGNDSGFTDYDLTAVSGDVWMTAVNVKPGFKHRIRVSGNATAVVRRLAVGVEERDAFA